MTETNAPPVNRNCMGRFRLLGHPLTYSFEGRFLICNSGGGFTVVDLFHTKTKKLIFKFSTATIGGVPLKTNDKITGVESAFAFDLNTMLILLTLRDSAYLAIGEVDFKRSNVFVKQTTKLTLSFQLDGARWLPLSYPPNLYEGVILNVYNHRDDSEFFTVKMETNNELQVSHLKVPRSMTGVECSGSVLYGLVYNETVYNETVYNGRKQIDLVKFSIESGTYVQESTINWQIAECPFLKGYFVVSGENFLCAVRGPVNIYLGSYHWIWIRKSGRERPSSSPIQFNQCTVMENERLFIKSNLKAKLREKAYEEQSRAWLINDETIARNTLAQLNDVQKKLEECLEMCTELKKKSLNEKSMYNRQQFDGARLDNTIYVPTQSTSQSSEENNGSQRIEQSVKTLQNRVECFAGMFHAAVEYYEKAE
ncbi:hypothetical protein M3Y96_00504800 [Aphelenchoides besseyi]|nr:hypothetical protein M3Y96_00504800 [Aphelenchoides besseyi]